MRQPRPWRRGGGAWYAQVRGEKLWLAPREATKTEAQRELTRALAERGEGTAGKARSGPTLTVRKLLNLFLIEARRRAAGGEIEPRTATDYEWHLGFAGEALGAHAASMIRPHHVQTWLDTRGSWGKSTRSAAVKVLRSAFRWGVEVGHLDADPLARLRAPGRLRREVMLAPEQTGAILAATKDRYFRELFQGLRESGCRPKELYTLTADRVSVEAGVWLVVDKIRRKTGAEYRCVYLTPELVELSRELLTRHPEGLLFRNKWGRAWTNQAVAARFHRLAARIDLPRGACAYALRHGFATQALARGVPAATVATLMGHQGLRTLMETYSKLDRESKHLKESAAKARSIPG